jgi:hypothetical protein
MEARDSCFDCGLVSPGIYALTGSVAASFSGALMFGFVVPGVRSFWLISRWSTAPERG